MSPQPLDYENPSRVGNPTPQVRWRKTVSFWLLGLAVLCALVALVWPELRRELFIAAITLGGTSVVIYFPYTGS